MREVRTGLIKPEYLSRMSELEANQNLNDKHANSTLHKAFQTKDSDRRSEFLETAKQHLHSAVSSAKERYQMSTVRRPKSKFNTNQDNMRPGDN
jgi:hypothetical protein